MDISQARDKFEKEFSKDILRVEVSDLEIVKAKYPDNRLVCAGWARHGECLAVYTTPRPGQWFSGSFEGFRVIYIIEYPEKWALYNFLCALFDDQFSRKNQQILRDLINKEFQDEFVSK